MVTTMVWLLRFTGITVFLLLLGFTPIHAQDSVQDDPTYPRDPAALAAHFARTPESAESTPDPALLIPEISPIYRPGDIATFYVPKIIDGEPSPEPVQVNAVLASSSANIYLWVEEGTPFSGVALNRLTNGLSSLVNIFKMRSTFGEASVLPGLGSVASQVDQMPVPDVDNDPHIYVLYTRSALVEDGANYNPMHSLPAVYAPTGESHAHETIIVNMINPEVVPPESDAYFVQIARALYTLILTRSNPMQAEWLHETMSTSLLLQLLNQQVQNDEILLFLSDPDLPLIANAPINNSVAYSAMQQFFAGYLTQRYGETLVPRLYLEATETGTAEHAMSALDAALAAENLIDPSTGAPITARDAFADFAIANILDAPIGDQRYSHVVNPLQQGQFAANLDIESLDARFSNLTVSQFGARYFLYTSAGGETITVNFDGSPTVRRLSMPADHDLADTFYWSGSVPDQHRRMVRTIDLTNAPDEPITLTFDAWHDLRPYWNYGYVTVSTDGGSTWSILSPDALESPNPYGAAYGTGFTGISSPDRIRPAAYLGVNLSADVRTVSQLVADAPASRAGVLAGDVFIGAEGELWTDDITLVRFLAGYEAGDTLTFIIRRGANQFDVPITLGEHPTRVIIPQPLWQPHSVDLSAYRGVEILLGFETVTLPIHEDSGFAIDNLAIPAINWQDDGDDAALWTLEGWQSIENTLPQTFMFYAITTGTQEKLARVIPLIAQTSDQTSGEWRIRVDAGETLVLVAAGLNDQTLQRAAFDLSLTSDVVTQ